jgi:Fic family protein
LPGIERGDLSPFAAHVRYEHLHPFTDGNGRSGRAIWAWQMLYQGRGEIPLGFLHHFYYQSIQNAAMKDEHERTG